MNENMKDWLIIIILSILVLSVVFFVLDKFNEKIDKAKQYCVDKCIEQGGNTIIFKAWTLQGNHCYCELNNGQIKPIF